MKCKILLVGCGWRSQIYRHAVSNLPNEFELCGILMHSDKRAMEIEKETGIRTTSDLETALEWNPVSWKRVFLYSAKHLQELM